MPVTVCLSERPVNLSGIAPAHAPLDLFTRHSEGAATQWLGLSDAIPVFGVNCSVCTYTIPQ